jgi:uncharacterized protein (TIGR01777 family)
MTRPILIERTSRLPYPAEEVYAWHERPGAFERLVPPWDKVEVLERTGGIADGTVVRLRVHLGPIAAQWVARHRDVIPGRQFVDEQIHGPFASWVHTHLVTPSGPGACELTDRIEYRLPCGKPGEILGAGFARRLVERMLTYRHQTIRDDLARHAEAPRQLAVAVTGASGLLGRALIPFLTTGGHRVFPLVRRKPAPGEIGWDPATGRIDAAGLEGMDAVIHLAGENIAGGRWTAERKRRIMTSRLDGTRLLADALAGLTRKPAVLVSASAIGIYGDRGDTMLTEESSTGTGFLADLGVAWEAAADPARQAGIRVVTPRLGIILTPGGGALERMLPPFRLGLGGPLGSGRQWMSWLTLDDAVGVLHWATTCSSIDGPLNVVAPAPVTNAEFAHTLGQALRRPAVMPVPAFALQIAFGELAREALLASQRVMPTVLQAQGYRFRDPSLLPALQRLLGTL